MVPEGASDRPGTDPDRRPPAVALTIVGWSVGAAVTALILGTPYLVYGFRNPALHLVLDSVDSSVALLVAYLLHGRFRRSRLVRDLLLAQGLLILALAGFGAMLTSRVLAPERPETFDVWLPVSMRVIGALVILGAALAGQRHAGSAARWTGRALPWLVIGVATLVLWISADQLPAALGQPPASAQRPVIDGHPVLLATQAGTAAAFMVASIGFTLQARRRPDPLIIALGPALGLGAFARVNYLLFPSLYTDWVYAGDLMRTGCYVVLLAGAAREISRYWSAQARAAVLEDRRRLARELHDGLVQELGFIRAEAHRVAVDPTAGGRIIASADRALDESRAAVDALGTASGQPLGLLVHRAARQVAERYGGRVEVDLDDSVDADTEQQYALVRITREAVSNALRHGSAGHVMVHLSADDQGRRLVVRDDGKGFDADGLRPHASGYGITSMRERAAALPGSLRIRSRPGDGTQVEVIW